MMTKRNKCYKLVFWYGLIQSMSTMLVLINQFLINKPEWNGFSNTGFDIAFLLCLINNYMHQNSDTDKNFLYDIEVWAILAAIVPFIVMAVRWSVFLIDKDSMVQVMTLLQNYSLIIEMFLFCWMIIATGFMEQKRWVIFPAVFLFTIFLISNIFAKNIWFIIISPIGYILLAVKIKNSLHFQ